MFDIECFPNWFSIGFMSYNTGKYIAFEMNEYDDRFDANKLQWLVQNMRIVGFYSLNYDLPMLWASLAGKNYEELYAINDEIIKDVPLKNIYQKYKFKQGKTNHIDIMLVCPSFAQKVGLKQYGSRIHVPSIMELPFQPGSFIQPDEFSMLRVYNYNDLVTTAFTYAKIEKPIKLREEMGRKYGIELTSLSDSQMAERIICSEIRSAIGQWPKKVDPDWNRIIQFKNPSYMQFYTPELQRIHQQICETPFYVRPEGMRILKDGQFVPCTNLWKVRIGRSDYKLGIGGLHSCEEKESYFTTENNVLIDRDVASYYPSIILNQQLTCPQLGQTFLMIYESLVRRRLEAKKNKDKSTADSLKICINAVFGKFGNEYSVLYSPDVMLQITITGQLSLLMLIEMLEWCGIRVISANTDGIVIYCERTKIDEANVIFKEWERITGFETEETRYKSIHFANVNNYIAIGEDGKSKAKGEYVSELSMKEPDRESLMKNPDAEICSEAVTRFLAGLKTDAPAPFETTIAGCQDFRKFLYSQKVSGGAVKNGKPLGRVIRWYIARDEFGEIQRAKPTASGARSAIPLSAGGIPVQSLGEFPKNLDYDHYIKRAKGMLRAIGYETSEWSQLELF